MNEDQQILEGQLQTEATREELVSEKSASKETPEASPEQEEEYANQLAMSQQEETSPETAQLQKQSELLSAPSLFKYGLILLFFAIPNDIIDILELTGFLEIFVWLISLFLSIGTILVMWLSDSEMQRVKNHMNSIEKHKKTAVKSMTKVASKISKFAPKNPLTKILIGTILEMIPIISILPWASICVLLAYWDERKAYKNAKSESDETLNVSPEPATVV